MRMRGALSVLVVGVLTGSSVAAQELKSKTMTPFALGKLEGQVQWVVANCGGRITPPATAVFKEGKRRNSREYKRGYTDGASLPPKWVETGGKSEACSAYRFTFGPRGLNVILD